MMTGRVAGHFHYSPRDPHASRLFLLPMFRVCDYVTLFGYTCVEAGEFD